MHRFLSTVPPQHLNLIQTLHVTMTIPDFYLKNPVPLEEMHVTVRLKTHKVEIEWLRSCLALAKMTGMKNLEIDLWNETYDEVIEEELLRGLCNVRVLEGGNFVVRLPWTEGNPIPKVERMAVGGFKLERRPFGAEPVSRSLSSLCSSKRKWLQILETNTKFSRQRIDYPPTPHLSGGTRLSWEFYAARVLYLFV
jgi:hypothetical protein